MSDKVEYPPSLDEWRALYEAAIALKAMAPWDWMTEVDIFGVQSPETDEVGFVSVMGMAGEHFAVAVYRGAKGLYGLWTLENAGLTMSTEAFLEIPQLQASFEDRAQLHADDRAVIKELGLKFRGRNEWPQFRSYRPGHIPWFIEADEARFLRHVLEQTLDVAPRFEDDPSLLEPGGETSYLIRVSQQRNGSLVWHDEIRDVPPPEPIAITLHMNMDALRALQRQGRRVENILEVDCFLMPTPVHDEDEPRPYYPYMLLVVTRDEGYILGTELLAPKPSLASVWGNVPKVFVEMLYNAGIVPSTIHVCSNRVMDVLEPVAEELDFTVKGKRRLPNLEEAKAALLGRFT